MSLVAGGVQFGVLPATLKTTTLTLGTDGYRRQPASDRLWRSASTASQWRHSIQLGTDDPLQLIGGAVDTVGCGELKSGESRSERSNYSASLLCIERFAKFHEFFCPEIFHEIFLKYFKNFTMLFSGFTLTCLTFFFIRQTLPFIHLCIYCSSLSLSAGLLDWFACSNHFTP